MSRSDFTPRDLFGQARAPSGPQWTRSKHGALYRTAPGLTAAIYLRNGAIHWRVTQWDGKGSLASATPAATLEQAQREASQALAEARRLLRAGGALPVPARWRR